ncbi:MAG: YraN family protein [PVC group bacterium]
MSQERLSLGRWGEDQAVRHLRGKRFQVLERNYTCPLGEIDIIARQGERLIFIEVKTKRLGDPPAPRYSVNRRKQRQIVRTARFYLKQIGDSKVKCRFDVVEIIAGEGRRPERIVHLPGAFRV